MISKNRFKFSSLSTFLTLFIFTLYRSSEIVETDVYWQTRAGLDWFNYKSIIFSNGWGYFKNNPWIPNSWGWNIVLGSFFKLSPQYGIFLFGFFLSSLFLFFLIKAARNLHSHWEMTHFILIITLIFSLPVFALRPALISCFALLMMIFYNDLWVPYFKKNIVSGGFLVLIFNIVMINLHLSWPAYFAAGLFGVAIFLLEENSFFTTIKFIFFIGVLSLIGFLINPLGLKLFQHAVFTVNQSTALIYEWKPLWKAPLYFFPVIVSFLSFIPALSHNNLKLWSATSVGLAIMGIFAVRFAPWAMIFSLPVWSSWLSSWADSNNCSVKNRTLINVFCLIGVIFFFLPKTIASLSLHGRPPYEKSLSLLAKNCHLIASQLQSNSVLLFRPDVKIFIDGRNDYWGKEPYLIVETFQKRPSTELFNLYNPTCILTESQSPLSLFLKQNPQWQSQRDTPVLEVWNKIR